MTFWERIQRHNLFLPLVVVTIFAIALSMRIMRIDAFLSYHEDQVRDMLYIQKLFQNKEFILLGPKASVGNFFLPPFWYYLMGLVYLFSHSPLYQGVMVAVISALTAVILFIFGYRFFGMKIAVIASVLYALSPISIEYSRFAWNPNPIPFFIALTLLGLYEFAFHKKEWGFVIGTVAANLALQLHYQGSIIFLFFIGYLIVSRRMSLRKFFIYILLNTLLISPFIIYELTHSFSNTNGILSFLGHSQSLKWFGIPFYAKFIFYEFSLFLANTLIIKNQFVGYLLLLLFALSFLVKLKNEKERLVRFFLLFSIFMLFIYKNSLIPFYLLFLIIPVIIYASIFLGRIKHNALLLVVMIFIIVVTIATSPTFAQTDDTFIQINQTVQKLSVSQNYCIRYDVFKETYIEKKFRYLFSVATQPPLSDSQICEKQYLICEPAKCPGALIGRRYSQVQLQTNKAGVLIYEIQ